MILGMERKNVIKLFPALLSSKGTKTPNIKQRNRWKKYFNSFESHRDYFLKYFGF